MKLEVTENLKIKYVNNLHTKLSHINIIQGSDDSSENKITQILKITKKIQISKENFHSKNYATNP